MTQTLQDLFKRYRRPGDLLFAMLFFAFSLFLLASLPFQTTWVARTGLVAQPAFWPTVSIAVMVLFGGLHLLGGLLSARIPGRLAEVMYWVKSAEYALWFLAYVLILPVVGYLPTTVALSVILTLRLGYRGPRWIVIAAVFGAAVVLVFKGLLGVRIPGGTLYRLIENDALRSFALSYL
ncbi:tripartite tricarboxylate transporter TctB family protein [Salipiger sp. IMCC34102]|uniref:tripartite tricarboxylate transporter TctB family protein n=1 Tax=Salipiger sp. IMCC34102 TaxID=2510647 RepID=UPI00101C594A|nr:tripartite tricarboxylate transporter TctB family protein [Salipiger sp. IMCC34102]RYH02631.1 tripartite tricarboxylate transporter TctB family protein [Salipiger sp. IMCC34102]